MTDSEVLKIANEIVDPYGLKAEFIIDEPCSVGVGGDCRTFTKAIVLIGAHPKDDTLASLSTEISNKTYINRITIQLAKKES